MAAQLKLRYLRFVRKIYRLLRSPSLKKRVWLQKSITPMFQREFWHPCRDSVAAGAGIGLFFSQLPIPGQMLFAGISSVFFRANIPVTLAACWVSNPITQIPIWLFQEKFGDFLRETIHIPVHPILERVQIPLSIIPGMESETLNGGSFILGFLSLGFLLFLLAFPVVYLLSALMPRLIPKTRYQRARAKVIKRQKKEETQNPKH